MGHKVVNLEETLTGLQRITNAKSRKDDHHYIVLSQLNHWLGKAASSFARGVLLDYGCGGQPYRDLFSVCTSQYIGADVAAAAGVTLDVVFKPGEPVPLPDASVDTILSTQTLEHVYDFHRYIEDCYRLLAPGGRLIITVPMQWRLHEIPFDFWRFTRFGLEKKLIEVGFSIKEMTPCGGVYSLLGQIYLSHLSECGRPRKWLIRLVNVLALKLDRSNKDPEDTLVWMCLAQK